MEYPPAFKSYKILTSAIAGERRGLILGEMSQLREGKPQDSSAQGPWRSGMRRDGKRGGGCPGLEEGDRELVSRGDRVSVCKNEEVLEAVGVEDRTAM